MLVMAPKDNLVRTFPSCVVIEPPMAAQWWTLFSFDVADGTENIASRRTDQGDKTLRRSSHQPWLFVLTPGNKVRRLPKCAATSGHPRRPERCGGTVRAKSYRACSSAAQKSGLFATGM